MLYRADGVAGEEARRENQTLAGLDAILTGHLAQATPIGDDPIFKPGGYTGKGQNKPRGKERPAGAKSTHELVDMSRVFLDEFEDVAMLLRTHRVDDDGDPPWSAERLAQYKAAARRFLDVTRRMADLEWSRMDHFWFASHNESRLLSTEEGREVYRRELANAPIVTDGKDHPRWPWRSQHT